MQLWTDTRVVRILATSAKLEMLQWLGGAIVDLVAEYAVDSVMERLCSYAARPWFGAHYWFGALPWFGTASVSTHRYIYSLQIRGDELMLVADITKTTNRNYYTSSKSPTVTQRTELADMPAALDSWLEPLVWRAASAEIKDRAHARPRPQVVGQLVRDLAAQILRDLPSAVIVGD
jgi:hypothetical protein